MIQFHGEDITWCSASWCFSVSRRCSLHEDGLVTWTKKKKKPSCLRHHVLNDVPFAGDLAEGNGAEVVSHDHTQDDFSVLD